MVRVLPSVVLASVSSTEFFLPAFGEEKKKEAGSLPTWISALRALLVCRWKWGPWVLRSLNKLRG